MNELEYNKLYELKCVLIRIYDEFMKQDDNHHKSNEGNIEIIYDYGNYFDEHWATNKPTIYLKVYSYVFSNEGRRKEWVGNDLCELLCLAIEFFGQFEKEKQE